MRTLRVVVDAKELDLDARSRQRREALLREALVAKVRREQRGAAKLRASSASAGDPVVRIVSTGAMLVRFAVPEERIAGLKAGDQVTVQLDGTSFEARIARLSPEVEPSSRTVFVEASPFAASGLCSDGCTGLAGRVIRVAVVRKDEANRR